MKIGKADAVEAKQVEMDQAEGVTMRMLIGPEDGAPTFNMRLFEVAPGGYTPLHTHSWEHEAYILAGEGTVLADGQERPISAGDCVFVDNDEEHQFRNTGGENLKFLCLVPQISG
ncbi:MAG: cupin domain-containing protein [Planctomycetota bacterium]|nr:cupin domain-containing protein [Planctomycetota bacterium]